MLPCAALAYPRALIRAEVEQVVLLDRAADAASELVALELLLRRGEKVPRVHVAVAQELEHIAVNLVRAGLGHHVDHSADRVAVFRAHIAVLDAEFLNGVGIRETAGWC